MTFMNDIYKTIANPPNSLTDTTVVEYFPTITDEDRATGYIERYFLRPLVHTTGYVTEISLRDYNRLKGNTLYNIISMIWRIGGPIDDTTKMVPNAGNVRVVTGVKTANTIAIQLAEQSMPGISNKLRNPLQFYKI